MDMILLPPSVLCAQRPALGVFVFLFSIARFFVDDRFCHTGSHIAFTLIPKIILIDFLEYYKSESKAFGFIEQKEFAA